MNGSVNLLVIMIVAFLLRLVIPTAALNQQAVWKKQLEIFQLQDISEQILWMKPTVNN